MSDIKSILQKYGISTNLELNDVEWRSENSCDNSILFYKFNSQTNSELEKFNERLSRSSFGICITNSNTTLAEDNYFCLDGENYLSLQEELLNTLYPMDFMEEKYSVGVTGTNGKTTTVYLFAQLMMQKKLNVLTVGTLGVLLNNKEISNYNLTTPAYIDLRKELFRQKDCFDVFAMELSSHALEQGRIGSLKFNQIAWTNLSQDHLDYHGTMDKYFEAKKRVYQYLNTPNFNVFIPETQVELISLLEGSEVKKISSKVVTSNPFFKMSYNLENLSLALALAKSKYKEHYDVEQLTASPGRFNIIKYDENFIVIDFAHTPDALKAICLDLKKAFSEYKLITLFGCGGDRDRVKRSLMAEAASEHSDLVILTSDNPRFEDPQQIINDARVGLKTKSHIEVDRKKAIAYGIETIDEKKTILLIAGKGHEPYMDIQGRKYPFNDKDYVTELIND